MHINELPFDMQRQVMASIVPYVQYYVVSDSINKREGIMDDKGGASVFGEDWAGIVAGDNPQIFCAPLEVTLH